MLQKAAPPEIKKAREDGFQRNASSLAPSWSLSVLPTQKPPSDRDSTSVVAIAK
jgi:hypothetical protein